MDLAFGILSIYRLGTVFDHYNVWLCFAFLAKICAFDIKQRFPSVQDVLGSTWVNPYEYSRLIKMANRNDILQYEVNSHHFYTNI